MASTTYNEIVHKLDGLEPAELHLLLADIQRRVSERPKRSLMEYAPGKKLDANRTDWVKNLRAEWNER